MSLRHVLGSGIVVVASLACSRSALDVELAGGDPDGGGDACKSEMLGTAVRYPGAAQASNGGVVIDPDDDLLVVIGGLTGGDQDSQIIAAVNLGTAESLTLARMGAANVALGAFMRTVWDPTYHRIVGLGGASENANPPGNEKQVFAIAVKGQNAEIASLPDFPDGPTGDLPLAAAIDPRSGRLLVVPEKAGVAGPTKTYALDLEPGSESWSLFATDAQDALTQVQFVAISYDPTHHAMIALATNFATEERSMWSLALDAPSSWTKLDGILPPTLYDYAAIISTGFPLVWDDTLCAFVTAVTSSECMYEGWRFDIGNGTFAATSLGLSIQPSVRFSRGAAPFDTARHNFVFPSGFDCEFEHDYVAGSVDFLPLRP